MTDKKIFENSGTNLQSTEEEFQKVNTSYQSIEVKPGNDGKRPEVTDKTNHIEYFEELMFGRVNMSPLPKIESLGIVIRFDIVGQNAGSWTIVVEDGILKRISRNYPDPESQQGNSEPLSEDVALKPTCIFRLDGRTFMSIIRREITPQQAFFEKKVQIDGDMALALKMNVLVNYM
jgi:hypothetical protein